MRDARSAFKRSHSLGGLHAPIVREHAVAPAADLEVGVARAPHVDLGEHRLDQIRIGHRHERPRDLRRDPALRAGRRHHGEHLRERLVSFRIHPEAPVRNLFTRARRTVPFGVGDSQRDRRIGGDVFGRGSFETQVSDEPDQVAAHAADGAKRLRLARQPVACNRCRRGALVALDHLDNRRVFPCVRRLGVRGAKSSPLEVRPQAGVVALDVEDIEPDALPLEPVRAIEPLVQITENALGHAKRGVRISPAEIHVDHVPREIVREEPVGPVLDERQVSEPFEEVVRVRPLEHRREQRLGRRPRRHAGVQRETMLPARHLPHERLEQQPNDLRLVVETRRGEPVPARQHVGDERQRQRMSARERQRFVVMLCRRRRTASDTFGSRPDRSCPAHGCGSAPPMRRRSATPSLVRRGRR